MARALKILYVEDDRHDFEVVRYQLARTVPGFGEFSFDVRCAESLAAAREMDPAGFDVILVDLMLPDSTLLGTLRQVQETFPRTPTVVLTGVPTRGVVLDSILEGADDAIAKKDLTPERLARALVMAYLRSNRVVPATWRRSAESIV